MRDWDVAHYGRIFNAACRNAEMTTIRYPEGSHKFLSIHFVMDA